VTASAPRRPCDTIAPRSRRRRGGERGRGYVGPHHVGFLVDDLDEARSRVEQHGATFFMGAPGAAPGVKGTTHFEEKFRDPDGIIFDISGHGWAGTAEWSKPQ